MKNKLKMGLLCTALSVAVFAGPLLQAQAETLPTNVQQEMSQLLTATVIALNGLSLQLEADQRILLSSAQNLTVISQSLGALDNSFQRLDEDEKEQVEDAMDTVIALSFSVVENEGDRIEAVAQRREEQSSLLSRIVDESQELVEKVIDFRNK